MIASIVGNYLMESGLITVEQLHDLLKEHRKVRVKLGLIAVSEGLMSQEEAERVYRLMAIMDMHFGEVAVQERYLTEQQVEYLEEKINNPYFAFAQVLENQQIMKMEHLEELSFNFQRDNHYSDSDMAALKSGNIDHILMLYLPEGSERYETVAGIVIRSLMLLVDRNVWVKDTHIVSRWETRKGAFQEVTGHSGYTCGLVCEEDALAPVACLYGQEHFMVVDEDALDAIGELVNCVNGSIASEKYGKTDDLELCTPQYSTNLEAIEGREFLVLSLRLLDQDVDLIISLNDRITLTERI